MLGRKIVLAVFSVVFFILILFFYGGVISAEELLDPQKVASEREKLKKELRELEYQIERFETVISQKQQESTTLERDISILTAKINKLKLEIKARDIAIANLKTEITETGNTIESLFQKSEREKASLGSLIRRINEGDNVPIIEKLVAHRRLNEVFREFDSFEIIQSAISDSLSEIADSSAELKKEQESLENQKTEEEQLKITQELSAKKLKNGENEKKQILKISKGEEAKYQKFLKENKEKAATVRSRLFLLAGSPAIPFEKAVEYANLAYKATGIRPAFLLALLTEESNLGDNLGSGTWLTALKDSKCAKQREAFFQITSELGFNPDLMPVSARAWYGYCGGAMGPAQFMPTTWLLYKNRISEIISHNPPNPWEPSDAFVAAALYLKDSGAVEGNFASERKAALKYLAGSNWNKKAYAFYGNDVMAIAEKYQKEIDFLKKS